MHFKIHLGFILLLTSYSFTIGHFLTGQERSVDESVEILEGFLAELDNGDEQQRVKRNDAGDRGVTNLDIRDAILQLLNVIREGNKKLIQHDKSEGEISNQLLKKLNTISSTESVEKKIDNISTFLLRMNGKLDDITRRVTKGGTGGGARGATDSDALTTLAQESFDILTLLPTYIENTKDAIAALSKETKEKFDRVEYLLVDESADEEGKTRSLAKVLKTTEANILGASTELKEIVVESGHMAESLFERVNDGHKDLTAEIKGLANVEKVLMDTADSVMETKRKLEFGVQQIIFKVGELVKFSGGDLDVKLKSQLSEITSTILSNQTEALRNLTDRVEKEIGQVWRQMGIMFAQVSSSINILEKVKGYIEGYVSKTVDVKGQVEGLSDRMVDVDHSLNDMLGQLSLVVQEFKQVKTGLSEAMGGLVDEIKEFKPEETPATGE